MLGFQPALAVKTPSAPDESAREYDVLIEDLALFEQQFKLGNVDETSNYPAKETFEQKLDRLEELVLKHRSRLLAERPAAFYRFIGTHAEAMNYFGTSTVADQLDLYLFAEELFRELPKDLTASDLAGATEERARLSSIIRLIVAGIEYLLTTGDFNTALTYARKLHEFVVKTGLNTKSDIEAPHAIVYQLLGRTLRSRGIDDDYQEAIDYFYLCNESLSEIAIQEAIAAEDIIYSRTRAALSLGFGAGFLFYNALGDLIRAKDAIRPARLAFLRDSGVICCQIYYHYFELLYASILREEAGELNLIPHGDDARLKAARIAAQAKLQQANEIIGRCATALAKRPKYFIHVLFNQALLYLYQGSDYYGLARECVEKLFEQCQSNPRWLANAFVVKSQLELRVGDVDAALNDAIKAYSHAGNHLPVKIEALLARGQAQLARNKLTPAQADIERALQLNDGTNLKLAALGNLLLVEVALKQRQPGQAYERLMQLDDLMPSIRQGSIINRHRELMAKLESVQSDYLINGNTEVLHYKKFEEDLQRWLLEKALREDKNVTRVAKRLQVTKKTIYMWLDRYNIKLRTS